MARATAIADAFVARSGSVAMLPAVSGSLDEVDAADLGRQEVEQRLVDDDAPRPRPTGAELRRRPSELAAAGGRRRRSIRRRAVAGATATAAGGERRTGGDGGARRIAGRLTQLAAHDREARVVDGPDEPDRSQNAGVGATRRVGPRPDLRVRLDRGEAAGREVLADGLDEPPPMPAPRAAAMSRCR